MPKKVAITGNIGSGKSFVCSIFKGMGIPVFYSDDEAKNQYFNAEVKVKMIEKFGAEIYLADGTINKALLSHLLFEDKDLMKFVENLIYPALGDSFIEWAEQYKDLPYVLFESAIIFEKGLQHRFDAVIHVSASDETRMRRVKSRDHCSEESVSARMKLQWDDKRKCTLADFVILHDFDDDLDDLKFQINTIDATLRKM